ncbi:MAG: threonine synthase [Pleomorphochaeta sp.]
MKFVCSKCGKKESVSTLKPKCECGGLWKLDFTPPKFEIDKIDNTQWNIFRYRPFLALIDDSYKDITLGEGLSPIINFDDNLMLKMDYFMPTLSYKDRGAAVLISHCKAIGVKSVVQDSSGNAGNSVAAYCAKANIKCEIFVPENTSPKKIAMIKAHGAKVNVVKGSRDHCADVCRSKVESDNVYYANHVYNPFFYEGTKTYIYEVYEQLRRIPENIFIPVGNGTLFLGVMKGLEELKNSGVINEMPKIFAIQSEYCAPLLTSFKKHKIIASIVDIKTTLAEGIAIGKPMRDKEILDYCYKYNVEFIYALEKDILNARSTLAKKGIYCEHTTAANYAAYENYIKNNGVLKDCLITMCGAGLKSDH